jgi:hypothetical protein
MNPGCSKLFRIITPNGLREITAARYDVDDAHTLRFVDGGDVPIGEPIPCDGWLSVQLMGRSAAHHEPTTTTVDA